MMRSLFTLTVFAAAIVCASHLTASNKIPRKPEDVSFCTLVANAERYDQQIVRVKAILSVGPEQAILYDPRCCCKETSTWVDFDDAFEKSSPKMWNILNNILAKGHRAYVVYVGRFDGPRRFNPPQGLNPNLAEILRKANSRYGHLNGYRFQFVPMRLEEAKPVSSEVPEFEWNKHEGVRRTPKGK